MSVVNQSVTIEKLDPVKIKQERLPFTMHMNYVLQNLTNPIALAIWCYLTSLPDDWKVHRNQLMSHFDIGRDKLGKALKYLHENKLIEYLQVKLDNGKFGTSHILVKSGYEFEVIHKNETALLKNRSTVLPDNGKTAPTKEIKNTKEIKKSFCEKNENLKKHDWAVMKPRLANVESQTTSYKPPSQQRASSNSEAYRDAISKIPILRRKYRQSSSNKLSTELPTDSVDKSAKIHSIDCV